ncbi:MAG TPA: hypothetical protein VF855_07215, partial [Acidimicrobiales bacterium]
MTGSDGVEAELLGSGQQRVELEVAVALDARVRRAPVLVAAAFFQHHFSITSRFTGSDWNSRTSSAGLAPSR